MSKLCPLLTLDPQHPEKCVEHQCAWYTQVMGAHPQTGQQIAEFGCAMAWMPVLLIESAQQMRQAGASVDKLTNEIVHEGDRTRGMFAQIAEQRMKLLEGH